MPGAAIGHEVSGAAKGIGHAAEGAGKGIEHGAEDAWNWLTGGGDKKKTSAAKEPEHRSKPQHGQYATKASSSQASPAAQRIIIDATPAAQKLIKAMVVTGGDPYQAAGAASAATPPTPQQTSTR